jgi:hypothetical protein
MPRFLLREGNMGSLTYKRQSLPNPLSVKQARHEISSIV